MNVLLIVPPHDHYEKMYPLALASVSAALKQAGHRVYGMDLSFESEKACSELLEREPVGLIGLVLAYQNLDQINRILNQWKRFFPIPVVTFGAYAAFLGPKLIEEKTAFDYVIVDEPELTVLNLVDTLEKKESLHNVNGLIWHKNGQPIVNAPHPIPSDINTLVFPDRTLLPLERYTGMICRNQKYTQMVTSSGCPRHCRYCWHHLVYPARKQRSPQNVVDEIEILLKEYQFKEIHFEDANFIGGDTNRVRQICQEILARQLKFDWQCSGVIPLSELTDLSIIDLMAQAGCYNLSLGIETFDQALLRHIGREQSFELLRDIIARCHRHKMEVTAHMMLGLPYQKLGQAKKDIYLSRAYSFDFIHYNIFHDIYATKEERDSRGGNVESKGLPRRHLSPTKLKSLQKGAYTRLIFKMSVLKFLFRRLRQGHNIIKIARKALYYLKGPEDLHIDGTA